MIEELREIAEDAPNAAEIAGRSVLFNFRVTRAELDEFARAAGRGNVSERLRSLMRQYVAKRKRERA